MQTPREALRDARLAARLSQRALAERAGTSELAIARYERGGLTPSWETLQSLVAACGREVTLVTAPVPDPEDIELAEHLLGLTPLERLRALPRYARLHELARATH